MAVHKRNHDPARSRVLRPLAVLAAVIVTVAAFAGGCTEDDTPGDDAGPAGTPGTPSTEPPVTTTVTVGRVAGRLGRGERRALKAEVVGVVDEFLDGAYLGEFPRASFDEAYEAFTRGARRDAERDADLLSNAEISDRIDVATGTKRHVALDVLAVKGRAQGVTARFTLVFDTAGELERRDRVKGSLLLTATDGGWKVFGYDVTRSVTA
jgi:hypothetical protein